LKTFTLKYSFLDKRYIIPVLLLPVWLILYFNLEHWINYLFSGLHKTKLTDAVKFFTYEVPKVIMLLILIIFAVGIIRTCFSPERTRRILGNKSLLPGNIMASMLGIVTPFCSCSAVPLFIGFVEAGVPLGVTFSFLIAAPLINEVAVVMLFTFFGWQTALLYMCTGLIIAIIAGYIIGNLKYERYIEEWVFDKRIGNTDVDSGEISFAERIELGYISMKEILRKVWLYIIIGIGVGAWIHGYVPENFMAELMGKNVWWSVPVSVIIGIPMYSNAAGIIPVMQALLEKGASLGTVLAFMMSVIGLSLPEVIILKKVLKMPLITAFVGIVGFGIIIIGYIFNFIL
jgi:uncharacterized protein